jgi:MutS domain V
MSPRDVYAIREAACQALGRRLGRWDSWISGARLASALLAVGLGVAAIKGVVGSWILAMPAATFAVLVVLHERVVRRQRRQEMLADLYHAGMLRTDDQWAGQGDAGERFGTAAVDHLYAADLDIYGRGGLYELLNVARTPIGKRTLAGWLERPASAREARARQSAVAELAARLDLREELALAGGPSAAGLPEEALSAWAMALSPGFPRTLGLLRLALAGWAIMTATLLVLWAIGRLPVWPAGAAALLNWLGARRWRAAVAKITGGVEKRSAELALLVSLMACLEREEFQAPLLRELRRALDVEGQPPSVRVARLGRLVGWLDARRNQFMALLLAPLQWSTHLALAIENWRRADGGAVVRWMDAVGTLDALIALGTFAFEHPDYPFPEIRDEGVGEGRNSVTPVFQAKGLGHPLLPARRRVVNDVALGEGRSLMIVSGSNMSGKSTMLRSVGTNVVLALCGAPVCARELTLSALQIGSTLRINDSLQDGKSRFYVELTRLKLIVDRAAGAPPLLFLLDEILHGTNSHDRRIGAEGLLRGLVARGAIGLVTTHDLALTEVADSLGPRAVNVHFEDHLEDGVMTFDYLMKPGVVRKSNALALMRAVGLDVDVDMGLATPQKA